MCESHHIQLNLKRGKQKVKESLKLVRSRKRDESASCSGIERNSGGIRAKRLEKSKRKRMIGEAEAMDEVVKKMKLKRGDLQLDFIRMVLKREVEKKKRKRSSNKKMKIEQSVEELTRILPNGIMAISPPSPTTSNVTSPCDVKVGAEPISITKRRYRSKNIEILPIGKMQVVPFKGNLVKAKKKCHWCGNKSTEDLIRIISLMFYIGLKFIATPPPTSLNTLFDEYNREPGEFDHGMEEGEDRPIDPISDIDISTINELMFRRL